ncbi:MAG: histidine kinase [Flavobacteriales bacterium]|nr:histidine kinase [Flavobacteriales bacterium]
MQKLFLVLCFFLFSFFARAQYSIDSLFSVIAPEHADSISQLSKINAILQAPVYAKQQKIRQYAAFKKGFVFKNHKQNFDSAKFYFDLAISIDTSNHEILRKIYNHKGDLARIQLDTNAIYYFEQAIKHSNKIGIVDSIFNYRIYSNVALALVNDGKYELALSTLRNSLAYFEKLQHARQVSVIYGQMAVIYHHKKDNRRAFEYQKKSYQLRLKENLPGLLISGVNLAEFYNLSGESDLALQIINQLLELQKERNISESVHRVWLMKGDLLCRAGKKRGLEIVDSLLEITSQKPSLGELYLAKTEYYLVTNNLALAETHVLKAAAVFDELQYAPALQVIYPLMIEIYEKKSNYRLALHFSKLKDSLDERSFRDDFVRLEREFNYSKEREEKIIAQNEKKNAELQAVKLKAQNEQNVFVILFAFVLILVLILLIKIRQSRQKAEKMRLEQKLLTSQMNPHFISNAMGILQTYIVQNKVEDSLQFLSGFARLSRGILTSSNEDFIPLKEEIQILKNYINIQLERYQRRINCNFSYDPALLDEELFILPMLVQPLVENAFEHGTSDGIGEINVNIDDNDEEYIIIEIQDKGKGIALTKAKSKRKSYSSGIIQERINMFNSKNKLKIRMTMDSSENGTAIKILFPKLYLT